MRLIRCDQKGDSHGDAIGPRRELGKHDDTRTVGDPRQAGRNKQLRCEHVQTSTERISVDGTSAPNRFERR
jgi:hypothetical protein